MLKHFLGRKQASPDHTVDHGVIHRKARQRPASQPVHTAVSYVGDSHLISVYEDGCNRCTHAGVLNRLLGTPPDLPISKPYTRTETVPVDRQIEVIAERPCDIQSALRSFYEVSDSGNR